MSHKPLIVGLTGGIGSGKSTVGRLFAERGVEVIDADVIARDLVAPGSPLLAKIARHFGEHVVINGELDRGALREIIFSAPAEKKWLENLLHPRVRQTIREAVARASGEYVIVSVPLLLESGAYDFIDAVLVVDCPVALQIDRVVRRDRGFEAQVREIIESQISREERLSRADDVIVNDGDLDRLEQEVQRLHDKYRRHRHR